MNRPMSSSLLRRIDLDGRHPSPLERSVYVPGDIEERIVRVAVRNPWRS